MVNKKAFLKEVQRLTDYVVESEDSECNEYAAVPVFGLLKYLLRECVIKPSDLKRAGYRSEYIARLKR